MILANQGKIAQADAWLSMRERPQKLSSGRVSGP